MWPQTLPILIFAGFSWLHPVKSYPSSRSHDCNKVAQVTTVGIVPNTTSLENLAIRSNGDILVTSVSSPILHQLSPIGNYPPISVAHIEGVVGLLGIVELDPDTFYVVGSNLTSTENSNGVWKVDLTNFTISSVGTVVGKAAVSQVRQIPSARQLNGMTRLAADDTDTLLISDSASGNVISLDVRTGSFSTVAQLPEMAPVAGGLGIGVNGIRMHGEELFFVNLDQRLFAKVPVSLANGAPTGQVEIIASDITFGDDFALSHDASMAFIATNGPKEVLGISTARTACNTIIASPLLEGASSVAVDMFQPDKVLYVTGQLSRGNNTIGHLSKIVFQC